MESFIQLFLVFKKRNLSDDRTKMFSQCKTENKHKQWIPYRLYPASKQRQTVENRNFLKTENQDKSSSTKYLLAQNN